jgi:glycine/D-amino acid oxidase-like deaminating enzyme
MAVDFLIVGGGIAGVSAAARLSALGSVLLAETEATLAHHASSRSAALYEPYYGLAPVVALSLAGEDEFRSRENGLLLSPRGLMMVAPAEDREAFETDLKAMRFEAMSLAEARAIVPILNEGSVALAAYAGHAWDVDTDLLIQSYLREAKARGAEVRTGSPVTALRRDGGHWVATTPSGEIEARTVVNAAGPWADQVARMAGLRPVGLTPYRRSVARLPAPGGHDVSAWPMIFGAGESWYAKPDAGALIVSPAEEDAMEPHDAWADDMVLAEGLARYEAMVTEPVTRLLANWAGLRTFAPDRVLVIGRDPAAPSFLWFAGQGGYGFQTAPGASALLSELVAGKTPGVGRDVAAATDPARFSQA